MILSTPALERMLRLVETNPRISNGGGELDREIRDAIALELRSRKSTAELATSREEFHTRHAEPWILPDDPKLSSGQNSIRARVRAEAVSLEDLDLG